MQDNGERSLAKRTCAPCRGGVQPLRGAALVALHRDLGGGWALIDDHHLEKSYTCKAFKDALAFVNLIGALAEEQNHHPDLYLAWGLVRVTIWTHKIDGLTESDFIFAAKTDKVWADYALQ